MNIHYFPLQALGLSCDRATFDPGIAGAFGSTFKFEDRAVTQFACIYGTGRVTTRLTADTTSNTVLHFFCNVKRRAIATTTGLD